MWVLNPDRVVESERNLYEAAPKWRDKLAALDHQLANLVEVVAAWNGGDVVNPGHRHVHVRVGGFQIDKRRIGSRKSLHE